MELYARIAKHTLAGSVLVIVFAGLCSVIFSGTVSLLWLGISLFWISCALLTTDFIKAEYENDNRQNRQELRKLFCFTAGIFAPFFAFVDIIGIRGPQLWDFLSGKWGEV